MCVKVEDLIPDNDANIRELKLPDPPPDPPDPEVEELLKKLIN